MKLRQYTLCTCVALLSCSAVPSKEEIKNEPQIKTYVQNNQREWSGQSTDHRYWIIPLVVGFTSAGVYIYHKNKED